MCGVFGFIAKDKGELNLERLERIAAVTESRGPHAFGFAWIDGRGRLKCFKQTGRITDSIGLLAMAADARMLIGHCRWATQGDHRHNVNNHPHPADGGWIVHNGVLPSFRRVIADRELAPVSDCDSEILGLLIEQLDGPLVDRCNEAVRLAAPTQALFSREQPLVMLGLWSRPARMVVIRRGNPLHFGETRDGIYLASLAEELPGRPSPVKDDTARAFTAGRRLVSLGK